MDGSDDDPRRGKGVEQSLARVPEFEVMHAHHRICVFPKKGCPSEGATQETFDVTLSVHTYEVPRAAPTTLMLEAMYTFDSVRPEIRYYDHDTQTQRSTHTTRPFACVASTTHGWSRQTIYYRYPSASHAFADYGLVAFDLERAAALIQHWQHRALL